MPVERACEVCGAAFSVPPRTVRRGGGRFCSHDCKVESQRMDPVTTECAGCGKPIELLPYQLRAGIRSCSWECRTIAIRGTGNPRWRGDPDYRGWDWGEARSAALERDAHRCVACGSDDRIVVHHIIPWKFVEDNSLRNLATLCRSCHLETHRQIEPAGERMKGAPKALLTTR